MRSLLISIALLAAAGQAQGADPEAFRAGQVVDALIRSLSGYVDPEVGEEVASAIRSRRDAFARLQGREQLAAALNDTLQSASDDKHLRVTVETLALEQPAAMTDEQAMLLERHSAHGLMALRRLPANVGYLKFRSFSGRPEGIVLIDAAMEMLKDTDALIIDLRENTGGGGAADARLLGHLSATPIPMEVIHWREPDGAMREQARHVSVADAGPAYPTKPVFVLIGPKTFSAAEAFVYSLKAAGRAVVVGERSRGGANPSNRPVLLGSGMAVFIPNGRVEHPTTRSNWEGVGIQPDVPVPADGALTEAYRRALSVARPLVETPRSVRERERAVTDPGSTLAADQLL